jgi:hypothetical protein
MRTPLGQFYEIVINDKFNRNMNSLLPYGLISFFLFFGFHCTDRVVNPPVDEGRIKLTVVDVSVHEAYIHIGIGTEVNNGTVYIYRDNEQVASFHTSVSDTIITDTSLQEVSEYVYWGEIRRSGRIVVQSNMLTVQTRVPSGRDIEWETYTFGEHSSSVLNDVVIIDENNIWVVGEIYMNDSSGEEDPILYNAVHWNGENWAIKRIIVNYRGSPSIAELRGSFSLPDGSIVLSSGLPYLPANSGWALHHLWDMGIFDERDGSVNNVWGGSPSNIYFVGNRGSIAHYNGSQWQKLESGTTTHITDVWGTEDPIREEVVVFCTVSSVFEPGDRKILKITDQNDVAPVDWGGGQLNSIYTNSGFPLFAAGYGIYVNSTSNWEQMIDVQVNKLRGNTINDIIAVGGLGMICHYNGVDWMVFSEVYNALYISVAMKDDLVAAVGTRDGKGVVTVGRRR